MVIMPLLAYSFTPVVNDEAKSFAILIQVRVSSSKASRLQFRWLKMSVIEILDIGYIK